MTPYFYNCPDCGPVEKRCRMADRDAQTCGCGEPLVRDLAAQFRSQALYAKPWFNHQTASDFLPDWVKGKGPHSAEHRKFANLTSGVREL